MDDTEIPDGYLPPHVQAWLEQLAEQHFDGDVGKTMAAVLEAAYERGKQPDNKWAELQTLMRKTGKPR